MNGGNGSRASLVGGQCNHIILLEWGFLPISITFNYFIFFIFGLDFHTISHASQHPRGARLMLARFYLYIHIKNHPSNNKKRFADERVERRVKGAKEQRSTDDDVGMLRGYIPKVKRYLINGKWRRFTKHT